MASSTSRIAGQVLPAFGSIKSTIVGLDKRIAVVVAILVAYGLLVVYSASLTIADASFTRQALGTALGLVVCAIFTHLDYRVFSTMSKALFVLDCVLILLPLVPFLSYDANGITGWVRVPFIGLTFQTSELAKPVTVMLMASLAARYHGRITTFADYARLCGVLAVPFALILLQPDLGTGLVLLLSGAAVIVMAGPKRSWVIATLVALLVFVVTVFFTDEMVDGVFGDERSLIKDYQINRLLVFINPELDTTGASYNLQQAMIAVGSGGMWGKGIGNASQSAAGFLPEAHTDFVFALLAEQFGFVGAGFLVACYAVLVLSTVHVAQTSNNLFGKLIAAGIATMWTFQIFENIGMCLSLMPITGIPLPFISFGSSSMIGQLLCVGLVQSVSVHRSKMG